MVVTCGDIAKDPMVRSARSDKLRIGIAGLGRAGRLIVPAIARHPDIELVAVADPVAAMRDAFDGRARRCSDIEALAAVPEVDAIYIATPTPLHARHATIAAAAGKHVICEKPMAVDLAEASAMVAAAERAGIVLLVGHSHSYDLPILKMRELIAGGTLGRPRMINTLCYTDWVYRPRRADELDIAQGGGVTFRQGAHQFDVLRLLGGGLVRTVRAKTFDWDPARRTIGAHLAQLSFEDGTAATAIYNGYGAFLSTEICFDIGELGNVADAGAVGAKRRAFRERDAAEELSAKRSRASATAEEDAPFQPFFGLTLVSCEGGDLRQSPHGLYVYTEQGRREVMLPAGASTRDLVLAEFYDAVTGRRRPLHDGRWGLANLELCAAAIRSSEIDQDVRLVHQVAVNDDGAR